MNFLRQIAHSLCQAIKQRLRQWTKPDNHSLVLNTVLYLTRPKSELVLENVLLHQQLIVLDQQINARLSEDRATYLRAPTPIYVEWAIMCST